MTEKCKVTNKSGGPSIYKLSNGFRREIAAFETVEVPLAELEGLIQVPGGRTMIENFLMVRDPEVLEYLLNEEVENEYWLTPEQIPEWMETCSLDEFKDALDLAPLGTIELMKDAAVKHHLGDYNKRRAMKDQLGFDVTVAEEAFSTSGPITPKKTERRAVSSIQKPTQEATTQIKIGKATSE